MKTYPLCIYCQHYKSEFRCKAFPNGIPKEIISRQKYHTKPVDGDNDIQFEPIDKVDKKELFRLGFSIY
jgi:hypothetical protein